MSISYEVHPSSAVVNDDFYKLLQISIHLRICYLKSKELYSFVIEAYITNIPLPKKVVDCTIFEIRSLVFDRHSRFSHIP